MMTKIPFVKMHGAGNDFVLIDNREPLFPRESESALIARLANRPTGIGCEGVILLENSVKYDFSMRFFNPDGSSAELCGNGSRCVAVFARDLGVVRGDSMVFETGAGVIRAQILVNGEVKLAMPLPKAVRENDLVVGVPHARIRVDDVSKVDVNREGRRIRMSAEYAPAGTNVDFIAIRSVHEIDMRTYERGVEAESFACGTGATAMAALGVLEGSLEFPVRVHTSSGTVLTIDGVLEGKSLTTLTLTGPVERVFSGEWRAK